MPEPSREISPLRFLPLGELAIDEMWVLAAVKGPRRRWPRGSPCRADHDGLIELDSAADERIPNAGIGERSCIGFATGRDGFRLALRNARQNL